MTTPPIAPVTRQLSALEAVFTKAAAARSATLNQYADVPTDAITGLRKAAALLAISDEARGTARDLATTVDTLFAGLSGAAADYVGATARAEAATPEYADYLRELTAQGALMPFLSEATAAAKLASAVADGRSAQARALTDLIDAKFPFGSRSADTSMLLNRAAEACESANEEDAEDFQTAIAAAQGNWSAARSMLESRLTDVLDVEANPLGYGVGVKVYDNRAGYYSPAFIFGELASGS